MITAVILAAGTSSRLGRPKQLLQFGDRTVIEHIVDRVLSTSAERVIVVLGHAAEEIGKTLGDRAVETVINPDYRTGQASSLTAGIRAAGDSEAIVVLLGDQPGISSIAVENVIAEWRKSGKPIVMSRYGSNRSHPILFDRSVYLELLEIRGDQGARDVIRRDPTRVTTADSGSPDLPPDIDTESAYLSLLATWEK